MRNLRLTILIAAVVATGCDTGSRDSSATSEYPRRPIKLVVPFGAGGGSDTFGRIIQDAIEEHDLLDQPLVIVNVPGAGGTIGSRRVKNVRPDGYTLLLLHEGILTAKHSAQANFGPEAFVPIAGTGDAVQVIAVAGDSPFDDLSTLMRFATDQPDQLVFSANIGAPSHFAGLMLEAEQDGAKFRYTQNGGGAKRFAALQGGHVDLSSFSIAEYVQFRKSGLRALAILGEHRHPEIPELPTAIEQGFDVISQNMQFWWAPLGTPPDRIEVVANAIQKVMQTSSVKERLAAMMMSPITLRGEELSDEISRRESRIAAVATGEIADLPHFPTFVLVGVIGLGLLALTPIGGRPNRTQTPASLSGSGVPTDRFQFAVFSLLTFAYVAILHSGWISFVPATALFTIACSGMLVRPWLLDGRLSASRAWCAIGPLAIVMSFAVHHLFTEILVVDLP